MIETLGFNYLSGWELTLGRFEALASGPHVRRNLVYSSVTFIQLLSRWFTLPLPYILLFLVFFIAGPWLILQRKMGSEVPGLIEGTYLVGLCYALALTFAVYNINPLRPVVPIGPRYLVPFFPFASIVSVYMFSILASKFWEKGRPTLELAGSLVLALFLLLWPTYKMEFFRNKFNAFIWKADSEYTEFAEKFQKGELILTGQKKIFNSMIARFKFPVEIYNREPGVAVLTLAPRPLCVKQLNKSPLDSNYENCGD